MPTAIEISKSNFKRWAKITETRDFRSISLSKLLGECADSYQTYKTEGNFMVKSFCATMCGLYLRKLSANADKRWSVYDSHRHVYLIEGGINGIRPEVRQIGEWLNDLGGFELMVEVAEVFVPSHDICEINRAWNRIGEWLA